MPVTKSARKALRQSSRKKLVNNRALRLVRATVKEARVSPTPATLKRMYSLLDMAVKKKVVHKNKASRLKSRLAKLLKKK